MGRLIWKLAFAAALVAVLGAGIARTWWDRQTTLERVQDQLEAMALLLEQHADRALEAGDKVAHAVAELAASALGDPTGAERLHHQMRRLIEGNQQIGAAWVLDAHGAHVAESWAFPTSVPGNFAFRDYFKAHQQGETSLHIGAFGVGGPHQRPRFTLSRPVTQPDGSFAGVAVVAVQGEYFEQVYRLANLAPGGHLSLASSSGALLAEWPMRDAPSHAAPGAVPWLTAERTLARFPIRVMVAMSRDAAMAGWRERTAITGGVCVALILGFSLLTRMGLASVQREEQAHSALRGAYGALEARVQERTAALTQSEMLLNRVLEHLPVGVGVYDASGRFIRRNAMLAQLGLENLPSTHPTEHVQWASHDRDGQKLDPSQYPGARALRGDTVVPGVAFLHRAEDGSEAWRRVSAVPLDHPGGDDAAAGIIVVEDIDQLKRSEEEISARLVELHAIYDTAPVGLCVLDRDLRFQRMNHRLAEINGLPAEEHIGRSVAEILPSLLEPAQALMRQVAETRQPVLNFEITGETPAQPGVQRSWLESWVPLFDDDGVFVGVSVMAEETTERKRAERELRGAHLRLTNVLAAAGAGTFTSELPRGVIHADAGAASLFGVPAAMVRNAPVAQVNARIHPDDLHQVRARVRAVLRGGTSYEDEYRVVRPDGSIRWLTARGRVDEERVLHGALFDVTALKEAQEEAEERERQLRLVADSVPAMIAYLDQEQRFRFVNRAYCDWIEREATELLGRTMREIAEPRTYAAQSPRIEAALRGEHVYYQGTPPNPKRGDKAIEAHYLPYVDAQGVQDGFFLFILNVTEQKRRETELRDSTQRLRLLVDELNHRVKNMLAIVHSIVRQTLRRPDVAADAREAIEARVLALGRSHELLSRATWGNVELATVARKALEPFGVEDKRATRLRITGPSVLVPPNVALSLGMAFHELATNAVKYGALASDAGRVDLNWDVQEDSTLALTWEERGGPPARPPARQGFGTRLLQQGLAYSLNGKVELDYAPEGVRCRIELPLPVAELPEA